MTEPACHCGAAAKYHDPPPYHCDQCDRFFASISDLSRHVREELFLEQLRPEPSHTRSTVKQRMKWHREFRHLERAPYLFFILRIWRDGFHLRVARWELLFARMHHE